MEQLNFNDYQLARENLPPPESYQEDILEFPVRGKFIKFKKVRYSIDKKKGLDQLKPDEPDCFILMDWQVLSEISLKPGQLLLEQSREAYFTIIAQALLIGDKNLAFVTMKNLLDTFQFLDEELERKIAWHYDPPNCAFVAWLR